MWGRALIIILLLLPVALAHVGYVVPEDQQEVARGTDGLYLLSALQHYWLLMAITVVVVVGAYLYLRKQRLVLERGETIRKKSKEYRRYIPWIARLGLGIALIGAGSADVFISPMEQAGSWISFLQILFGFLLLAGFLTGIVAALSLVLFVIALTQNWQLIGNLDFLGLVIALLVLGETKPGVDDLFEIPFMTKATLSSAYVPLILRVGIGVAMVFLALYEKLLNPHLSELVVHSYGLQSVVPVSPAMWVLSAGLIELAVGIALLLGLKTRLFSAIAFVVLSLSFFYFSEAVFSHITLFATLSILFVTGAGKVSVDNLLRRA